MGKHITDLPAEFFRAIITQIARVEPPNDVFGDTTSATLVFEDKMVRDYLYALCTCRAVNNI